MWWCSHFKRPLNDPLLQELTPFELVCQFYLFFVHEHPDEAAKIMMSQVQQNTQVITGDVAIDQLEETLAKGLPMPDLINTLVAKEDRSSVRDFLTKGALEQLAREASRQAGQGEEEDEETDENWEAIQDHLSRTQRRSSDFERGVPSGGAGLYRED